MLTTLIDIDNTVEDNEVLDTPLHDASKRGNIGFLEECLMNGVSCNACFNYFVFFYSYLVLFSSLFYFLDSR